MVINSLQGAVEHYIKQVLKTGDIITAGMGGYYQKILTPIPGGWQAHYVFFKRDWFNSFPVTCRLPEFKGEKAQTISKRARDSAHGDNAKIAIVLPNGDTYSATANTWVNFNNKYPTSIREATNSHNDLECSVAKSVLQQIYPQTQKPAGGNTISSYI